MRYEPAGGWGAASTTPSDKDRLWATIAHAGCFVAAWLLLGILCPVIVLAVKSRSPFVRHHAYESLNFQLNTLAWILVASVLGFVTLGLLAFLLLPIIGVWYVVFVVLASMAANRGELYRYPLIVRVIR
jgi:uncharacterized Tic20 family protein